MRGVKEDRYGGEELPPFSMAARAMMRTTGGPSTAITEAIVEGGGSAGTKRSKRDAPPQAWTIRPLSGLRAPPPPNRRDLSWDSCQCCRGGRGGLAGYDRSMLLGLRRPSCRRRTMMLGGIAKAAVLLQTRDNKARCGRRRRNISWTKETKRHGGRRPNDDRITMRVLVPSVSRGDRPRNFKSER
jgi:hypothetical protein